MGPLSQTCAERSPARRPTSAAALDRGIRPARIALRLAGGFCCLVIASMISACAMEPQPVSPPSQTGAGQVVYQQQAGYGGREAMPQQPIPAPSATAQRADPWSVPGLVEMTPRTVPDAVAQLDRAEQLLGFVLTPGRLRKDQDDAGPAKEPPSPSPIGAPADGPVPLGDPCLIACAALASMKRSAEHVCSMAGEGDASCGSARARVQRAEQRVTSSCPACAAGK